jgi:hypothetical protein
MATAPQTVASRFEPNHSESPPVIARGDVIPTGPTFSRMSAVGLKGDGACTSGGSSFTLQESSGHWCPRVSVAVTFPPRTEARSGTRRNVVGDLQLVDNCLLAPAERTSAVVAHPLT